MRVSRPRLAARLAAVAGIALIALGALAGPAVSGAAEPSRVMLVFWPRAEIGAKAPLAVAPAPPSTLERLGERGGLSLGLTGATQGRYVQEQALLDISQGTRTSYAAYKPQDAPQMAFYPTRRGGLFQGWLEANARADSAPADIVPGLLASSVPGGSAYVGVQGRTQIEAIAAADRSGRVPLVSLGTADDLARRARMALERSRFVVVGLPTGDRGGVQLDELLAARRPGELLIVMQSPPDVRAPQLLPTGVAGLPGRSGGLTSDTTRLQGVVAGIDVLPTVLDWLHRPIPRVVKGQALRVEGPRDAAGLQRLDERLRVVGPRRFPALETVLAGWLALVLALGLFADRRGVRAAMRIGALALLWILPVLLLTAALQPGRTAELAIIAGGAFALAALTDRLVPWPRAPAVPGLVAVTAYVVDLALGSPLIIRSLLGPNPRFGSRYYGIGNELEATLPVLLLLALAALLAGRGRSRRGAAVFGLAGLGLGAAIGSGRLGADVGGVITVGAGIAVAVLFMVPGGVTRRGIALAVAVPALALVGLALLDLATGGNGHFTRTVLHADGESALQDIAVRRYELAFNVLRRGLMPFVTGIAILALAYGLRHRHRIYAPLGGDAAWTAALAGSLAAAVTGTLFNDSGPVLLLFGTVMLAAATAYVRGDPRLAAERSAAAPAQPPPGRTVTQTEYAPAAR
jgi:hypothetical protein